MKQISVAGNSGPIKSFGSPEISASRNLYLADIVGGVDQIEASSSGGFDVPSSDGAWALQAFGGSGGVGTMKQRVIFYYDDQYDAKIHEFFETIPTKRRGEAIRAALVKVIEGTGQPVQEVAPVVVEQPASPGGARF